MIRLANSFELTPRNIRGNIAINADNIALSIAIIISAIGIIYIAFVMLTDFKFLKDDWVLFALAFAGMIAFVYGIRLLFTGIKIEVDTSQKRIDWKHIGIFRTSSVSFAVSEVELVLHPTVIQNPRGFDWHGFAVTIINVNNQNLQLSRSKKIEQLRRYAMDLSNKTGIVYREIQTEQTPSGNPAPPSS
jgi:hypothetical protein